MNSSSKFIGINFMKSVSVNRIFSKKVNMIPGI